MATSEDRKRATDHPVHQLNQSVSDLPRGNGRLGNDGVGYRHRVHKNRVVLFILLPGCLAIDHRARRSRPRRPAPRLCANALFNCQPTVRSCRDAWCWGRVAGATPLLVVHSCSRPKDRRLERPAVDRYAPTTQPTGPQAPGGGPSSLELVIGKLPSLTIEPC